MNNKKLTSHEFRNLAKKFSKNKSKDKKNILRTAELVKDKKCKEMTAEKF